MGARWTCAHALASGATLLPPGSPRIPALAAAGTSRSGSPARKAGKAGTSSPSESRSCASTRTVRTGFAASGSSLFAPSLCLLSADDIGLLLAHLFGDLAELRRRHPHRAVRFASGRSLKRHGSTFKVIRANYRQSSDERAGWQPAGYRRPNSALAHSAGLNSIPPQIVGHSFSCWVHDAAF